MQDTIYPAENHPASAAADKPIGAAAPKPSESMDIPADPRHAARRADDSAWINEQLRKRSLPGELAALFHGHDRGETSTAMDAIALSLRGGIEDGVRKRIAGTAPVIGAAAVTQSGAVRRAFGLKR